MPAASQPGGDPDRRAIRGRPDLHEIGQLVRQPDAPASLGGEVGSYPAEGRVVDVAAVDAVAGPRIRRDPGPEAPGPTAVPDAVRRDLVHREAELGDPFRG